MCSAVRRRMFVNGHDLVAVPARTRHGAAAGGGLARTRARRRRLARRGRSGAGGAGAERGGGRRWPVRRRRARGVDEVEHVSRVIRPPSPVPVTSAGSIPFSRAACAPPARGPVSPLPAPLGRRLAAAVADAGAAGGGAGARPASDAGAAAELGGAARVRRAALAQARARAQAPERRRGRRRRAAAGAVPRRRRIRPIDGERRPTSTVSPSGTRISARTPGRRRGDLGVDLVGRDLEEGLVAGDGVAHLPSASG